MTHKVTCSAGLKGWSVFFPQTFLTPFRKRNMSPQTVLEVALMAKHNPGHSLVTGYSLNINNALFHQEHLFQKLPTHILTGLRAVNFHR